MEGLDYWIIGFITINPIIYLDYWFITKDLNQQSDEKDTLGEVPKELLSLWSMGPCVEACGSTLLP